MHRIAYIIGRIALLVSAGSAILLFACDKAAAGDSTEQDEATLTMYGENLVVEESENGRKSYRFTTPLLEEYGLAKEPYREFRKGVNIVTYKENDTLSTVDATLRANYAIYYTDRELWEARGNVVAETSEDRTLYTEQLFWNMKTKRIYSNVDTKIVQADGVFYGEGFESDDALRDWRFRRTTGRMEVEVEPQTQPDSVGNVSSAGRQPDAEQAASAVGRQPDAEQDASAVEWQADSVKEHSSVEELPARASQTRLTRSERRSPRARGHVEVAPSSEGGREPLQSVVPVRMDEAHPESRAEQ